MKIDSIYISAFGKFENKTFDFTDGLNLIYGENEDGKTTIINFIRMMFYGSNVKSNEPIYSNPRKKYAPRSDKAMAGSIDFTVGNRKYRIERIFKATNAADKINVTDLSTGEISSFTGKDDLGKRFIGLSADAADRSIFLMGKGAISENPLAQDELNSRLSNLADTGIEDLSVEAVTGRLEKARNLIMTKTGRGGKLIKDKEKLDELTLQLSSAKIAEQERKELSLSIENLKSMLGGANQDIARLTAQIKTAEGGKRYAKLKELTDTKSAMDKLYEKLVLSDGSVVSNQMLSNADAFLGEYKILTETYPSLLDRYNRLENEIQKLKDAFGGESADDIKEKIAKKREQLVLFKENTEALNKEREELKQKESLCLSSKPKIIPVFLVLFILFIAVIGLSFILGQYKLPLLITGGIGAIISLILTLFVRKKPKNNLEEIKSKLYETETIIQDNNSNILKLGEEITALTAKEAVARQKEKDAGEAFESKYEEYKKCSTEMNIQKQRKEEIEKLLCLLCGEKEVSIKGIEIILFSHKSNLNKYEALSMKFAMLKKDLDDISIEEATEELSSIPEGAISVGDLDSLNERLIFKKQEAENLRQRIADDSARAATEFAFHTHPSIIEKEINKLKALIEKETRFCESIDIASTVLQDAFAKVREGFGSALAKRTEEIFSSITNGKYKSVNVSKSFDISVEESDVFGTNSWQSLSDGTIDQAYFALRLTVSEFLSKDSEKLPLILDDPFDRYDDNRAEKAMEFLKAYSKDSQAILFTCHKLFTENNKFHTL